MQWPLRWWGWVSSVSYLHGKPSQKVISWEWWRIKLGSARRRTRMASNVAHSRFESLTLDVILALPNISALYPGSDDAHLAWIAPMQIDQRATLCYDIVFQDGELGSKGINTPGRIIVKEKIYLRHYKMCTPHSILGQEFSHQSSFRLTRNSFINPASKQHSFHLSSLGWPHVPVFRDLSRFYVVCPGAPTTCAKKQNSLGFWHIQKENQTVNSDLGNVISL